MATLDGREVLYFIAIMPGSEFSGFSFLGRDTRDERAGCKKFIATWKFMAICVNAAKSLQKCFFSCLLTDDVAIFPSGTFFNYIDKIRFTKSSQKLPKKKPKVNLDTCELLHGNGRWSERPRNV